MKKKIDIYSIGHSVNDIDTFIKKLKHHKIEAIADVRSSPYSKRLPQFNREPLKKKLAEESIKYVFLGKELGARSDDPLTYEGNMAVYEKIAETPLFESGMERLEKGASMYRISMMCAEKEPLDCHRTILVGRFLNSDRFNLMHILDDDSIETHSETMNRLLEKYKLGNDLFESKEDLLNRAYEKRGKEMAYRRRDD